MTVKMPLIDVRRVDDLAYEILATLDSKFWPLLIRMNFTKQKVIVIITLKFKASVLYRDDRCKIHVNFAFRLARSHLIINPLDFWSLVVRRRPATMQLANYRGRRTLQGQRHWGSIYHTLITRCFATKSVVPHLPLLVYPIS